MKTLATYKREYARAKTQKGTQSAMNKAMLNLYHSDREKFVEWQIKNYLKQPINQ
jgi:hypothetical protein